METSHDDTHDAADVGAQHPADQAGHQETGGRTTLALISDARRALAEAATLPDIRKVMEAASVAADAGRRAARLATILAGRGRRDRLVAQLQGATR